MDVSDLKIDPEPPSAGLSRGWKALVGVLVAALGGAVIFIVVDGGDEVQDERRDIAQPAQISAQGASPARSEGKGNGFQAGGYLEVIPPGPWVVTAMVDGRVEELSVVAGDVVAEGDVLLRFDDTLDRQDVSIRESQVALAEARLRRLDAGSRPEEVLRAEAELKRAVASEERAQKEFERTRRAVSARALSDKALDDARAELAHASATVEAFRADLSLMRQGTRREDIAVARAELNVARVELERAQWRVDAATIRAPMDATVLEVLTRPGDWVARDGDSDRGGALLTLFNPARLHAWVDVNQRDIGKIRVGQEALLYTDARPELGIKARVSRIMPRANLQRNTVEVKVELLEPHEGLRPDMAARVHFME